MCSTRTSVVGNGPGIILPELAEDDTSYPGNFQELHKHESIWVGNVSRASVVELQ